MQRYAKPRSLCCAHSQVLDGWCHVPGQNQCVAHGLAGVCVCGCAVVTRVVCFPTAAVVHGGFSNAMYTVRGACNAVPHAAFFYTLPCCR